VNTNGCLQISDEDVRNLSPLLLGANQRQTVHCPAIVAVGGLESDEFRRQSGEYAKILQSALAGGVQLIEVEGKDHFDIIESLRFPETPLMESLKVLCWQE